MNLKVRPFETTVDGVKVEGFIEGEQFRLQLFGRTVPVTTVDIGVDKNGPYARIGEMERQIDFGYTLKIEPEYDEDLPPGCRIAIFRDKTDSIRAALESDGTDPDSVNLIATVSESVSVYFDPGGNINGSSQLEPPPLDIGDYDM